MWSPEMHQSHPLNTRDGPGGLQEDPEPGKLSRRGELAQHGLEELGALPAPGLGALLPLQHPQNSSAPPAGALGMCNEFL